MELLRVSGIGRSLTVLYGVIALCQFTGSCTDRVGKDSKPEEVGLKVKPAIIKKPVSSYNDTLRIEGESAVFYRPDSLQMDRIRAVNEKAIFEMLTHDCHYQMENARLVVRKYWPRVRMAETFKARYLLFVKTDKSRTCIDLNEKNDICGVFLFDGRKAPVLADMPNIDTALGFYFKKK